MSEGELESLLRSLREESRGIEAPPRVEAALRKAFRSRNRSRGRWMWAGLAAAATIVLASGAVVRWMSIPVEPLVVQLHTPAPPPIQLAVAKPAVDRPVAKRPRRAPAPLVQKEEVTTEFLPLDEAIALPPIESAQVVRVSVPRGELVRFGVPVNRERMLEPIPADVVFAQDGIARAIRFVNYKGER